MAQISHPESLEIQRRGERGKSSVSTQAMSTFRQRPLKILNRVVEMSTLPGELVLDPFGGSSTTFVVCEEKKRYWIGIEIDFAQEIVDRLENDDIQPHPNDYYVEG